MNIELSKKKIQDLSKTNYNLGIKHLEEGNLKEAIFRFKITKKFWPHNYEAYYELIYCLILENEFEEAQKVIDELLEKSPDYKERIDQLFLTAENLEAPEDLEVAIGSEGGSELDSEDLDLSEELKDPEDLQITEEPGVPEELEKSIPIIFLIIKKIQITLISNVL